MEGRRKGRKSKSSGGKGKKMAGGAVAGGGKEWRQMENGNYPWGIWRRSKAYRQPGVRDGKAVAGTIPGMGWQWVWAGTLTTPQQQHYMASNDENQYQQAAALNGYTCDNWPMHLLLLVKT
nr:hypothetical protein Iba_chr10cCG7650 [Ipomoea batatas]